VIGPVKYKDQEDVCRNGHWGSWSLSTNSSGWRWRCRRCEANRKLAKSGRAPKQEKCSAWDRMQDYFDIYQWDYSGPRLVARVAEACGVSVQAVEKALARHRDYSPPN
jgi:hypothetical protein